MGQRDGVSRGQPAIGVEHQSNAWSNCLLHPVRGLDIDLKRPPAHLELQALVAFLLPLCGLPRHIVGRADADGEIGWNSLTDRPAEQVHHPQPQ